MKERLEAGGLVVYPTSTLPGLGCIPTTQGLDNLFITKSRSENMPVSLGIASLQQASMLVKIPEFLPQMLNKFPKGCLLYTSPSPRDRQKSRMPSSA